MRPASITKGEKPFLLIEITQEYMETLRKAHPDVSGIPVYYSGGTDNVWPNPSDDWEVVDLDADSDP